MRVSRQVPNQGSELATTTPAPITASVNESFGFLFGGATPETMGFSDVLQVKPRPTSEPHRTGRKEEVDRPCKSGSQGTGGSWVLPLPAREPAPILVSSTFDFSGPHSAANVDATHRASARTNDARSSLLGGIPMTTLDTDEWGDFTNSSLPNRPQAIDDLSYASEGEGTGHGFGDAGELKVSEVPGMTDSKWSDNQSPLLDALNDSSSIPTNEAATYSKENHNDTDGDVIERKQTVSSMNEKRGISLVDMPTIGNQIAPKPVQDVSRSPVTSDTPGQDKIGGTASTQSEPDAGQSHRGTLTSAMKSLQEPTRTSRPLDREAITSTTVGQIISGEATGHPHHETSTGTAISRPTAATIQGAIQSAKDSTAAATLSNAMRGGLHVGVHTEAFGRVTIQANSGSGQLSAQVSLEDSKQSAILAAHLPALEQRITQRHGLDMLVHLSGEAHAGSANAGSTNGQPGSHTNRSANQQRGADIPLGHSSSRTTPSIVDAGGPHRLEMYRTDGRIDVMV